ncbi:hypothetical protein [Adonisia turfae]|uniref:hypothetical protein n=1 Tax=Adonisia turfae TaxID=2950184 RepID=UPI0020299480|nr:hypothetical protein [Adonisia turfae]
MVPIRDENPVQITPYVTYGPITPNVLGFLYELTLSSSMELPAFFSTWTLVPEQLDGLSISIALSGLRCPGSLDPRVLWSIF